jgi:virulence factor
MLEVPGLDAVYVIIRPLAMFEIAMDVIRAGKHVFAEKPLGGDLGQTIALAQAAEAAGIKSAVGCNRRYCAVVRKAKEIVEARGPISAVLAEYHKDCRESLYGIGILHADGVHALDAMRFLGGDVASVHAHSDRWYRSERWEGLNNVFHALVRFESGASGIFVANRQGGARREYFEVHGRDISAYVHTPDRLEVFRAGESQPEIVCGEDLVGSRDPLMTYGYYHESVDFLDAIRTDRLPETNFSDNLKTMRLCERVDSGDHIERIDGA